MQALAISNFNRFIIHLKVLFKNMSRISFFERYLE